MTTAWGRVFGAAKDSGVAVGVTHAGGETVHAVVTGVGFDFVTGDTAGDLSVAVVIPFRSIVSVVGVLDPGPASPPASPPVRFFGMLENLMRLNKTVVVHTQQNRWSGVLVGVHAEFLDLRSGSGQRRIHSMAAVVCVSVRDSEGVDNT